MISKKIHLLWITLIIGCATNTREADSDTASLHWPRVYLPDFLMPNKKYGTPRTFVIGDVHGQYHMLEELLEHLDLKEDEKVYFLGDLIDRGPGSRKVIELIRSKDNFFSIRGNHEDMAIKAHRMDSVEDRAFWYFNWLGNGGVEFLENYNKGDKARLTLRKWRYSQNTQDLEKAVQEDDYGLPDDVVDWMQNLKLYYDLGDYFLVHAGLKPYKPISQQEEKTMVWSRDMFDFDQPLPGKMVIVGHTITKINFKNCRYDQIAIGQGWLAMDTGSYKSQGLLTALDLSNQQVYQVNQMSDLTGPVDLASKVCVQRNRNLKWFLEKLREFWIDSNPYN